MGKLDFSFTKEEIEETKIIMPDKYSMEIIYVNLVKDPLNLETDKWEGKIENNKS